MPANYSRGSDLASMTWKRTQGNTVASFLVLALAFFLLIRHISPPMHVDTNAFYCGARVLMTGHDPYRFQPLHACEAQNLKMGPSEVVPMPLPPYAIAMWFPLSLLPFAYANAIWLLLILGSALTITVAVTELTLLPVWLVSICVLADMLVEPLANGAMAPVPIALLSVAAVLLSRQRYVGAALAMGLAAIQPHVALPVMLAVFALVPRMRWPILTVSGVILIISSAFGFSLEIEYFRTVLPLHAVSEFGSSNQYSLSALLHLMGLPDRLAVAIGTLQYAIFVALGILLAAALRYRVPGALVFAPLACAVTGGTFIHQTEIAGALPLAFAVAAAVPVTSAWLGVLLIATPLEYILDYGASLIFGLVLAAILIYRRQLGRLGSISVALILSVLLAVATRSWPVPATNVQPAPVSSMAFSDVPWTVMQSNFPPENVFWWPSHFLAYLGLALTLWTALRIAMRQDKQGRVEQASLVAEAKTALLPNG